MYSSKSSVSPPIICVRTYHDHIIELLRDHVIEEVELYQHKNYIKITSKTFCDKILEYLNCDIFDNFQTNQEKLDFMRGVFDAENTTVINSNLPKCIFISPIPIDKIYNFVTGILNLECVKIKDKHILVFTDNHCVDFLGLLYNNTKFRSHAKYLEYLQLLDIQHELPKCIVYKTDNNAIIPCKTKITQLGYDINLIKLAKRIGHIHIYDTGIKMNINHNYYAEIVSKNIFDYGYLILGKSIIESDEPIVLTLLKIDHSLPDISLPFKCMMVFRKIVHMEIQSPL